MAGSSNHIDFRGEWGGEWWYDDLRSLGDGGLGTVYVGGSQDGAKVAVKVIPPVTPSGVQLHPRLHKREVDIAKKLRVTEVKYLIRYLDYAVDGENLLMVMELAESELDITGPREDERVVEVLRDIASGLSELHDQGLIHRDLKPPNVLFHDDKWKLSDFGIARDVDIDTGSPTYRGWGSPEYMAPELFTPPHRESTRSDLYALGCIAYALLVSHPPFVVAGRERYRLAELHAEEPVPVLPDHIDAQLRRTVIGLLQKEPLMRPPDARAVLEDLRRVGAVFETNLSALRDAAVAADQIEAHEAALVSAAKAQQMAIEARKSQARRSLQGIMAGASEDIQQVLPDTKLRELEGLAVGDGFLVQHKHAYLEVAVWREFESSFAPDDDQILLAGQVRASSKTVRGEWDYLVANIAYEGPPEDERWFLYRFRKSALVADDKYSYGPADRAHGLLSHNFVGERGIMLSGATHVWSFDRAPLSAQTIIGLFVEAVRLVAE